MNLISKILLGFVIIAVFACIWYLLTQKNSGKGGCCGDCSGCCSACCGDEPKKQDK